MAAATPLLMVLVLAVAEAGVEVRVQEELCAGTGQWPKQWR